jgi:GNAT superfamily N-acetyltransferase
MKMINLAISEDKNIPIESILQLYTANKWSSAEKPDLLHKALKNSHCLVSVWNGAILVGLGNAISDGYLVVYFPHLLVHPDYQNMGIGRMIMMKMQEIYGHFHMQMLTSDHNTIGFYQKMGFSRAGNTQAMWIYKGNEH